jgi:DsbC/DsbD-like thiol-disulfide interchange protein
MSATVARFLLLFAFATPAATLAARSEWAAADASEMRLLLLESAEGTITGGVQMVLEPGWHTYWRTPGESGVPPIFDFSGSENVADVKVSYPAPERLDQEGSVSLVYHDEVVFPLAVTPVDADRPVTLRLALQFGVCREVCIPTKASSELTYAAASGADPLAKALLERFQMRVPNPPQPGRFDVEKVVLADDALLIDVRMPDSSYSDLFAEAPAGWYVGQPVFLSRDNGVSRYRLSVAGRPDGGESQGNAFRFVAVAGGEAIEQTVALP